MRVLFFFSSFVQRVRRYWPNSDLSGMSAAWSLWGNRQRAVGARVVLLQAGWPLRITTAVSIRVRYKSGRRKAAVTCKSSKARFNAESDCAFRAAVRLFGSTVNIRGTPT
jgi:hypothetical protein